MRDISGILNKIMQEKQCSSVYAFLLLSEGEDKNGLYKLQSKPNEKISRRLCDKSNFQKFE